MTQASTPYPPGARIVVREAEWMVRSCTATEFDGFKIRATGVSELVRDEDAVFFTALETKEPKLLDPEKTILVPDHTPRFVMSRLFLEATLRRTRCRSPNGAWRCRTGSSWTGWPTSSARPSSR